MAMRIMKLDIAMEILKMYMKTNIVTMNMMMELLKMIMTIEQYFAQIYDDGLSPFNYQENTDSE